MAYEEILAETQGRVGVIRLNRPRKLNAWTETMSGEIVEQMTAWNEDDGIGAVVLTGEGRAFCAGADVGNFAQRVEANREGQGEGLRRGGYNLTAFMRDSKPTVAAINGYAVGVGLTMILPCDVRIASTAANLSIRFIKMGLMPELGSTRLLAQLVGLGNATDMCLTGRMVPAEEALRIGLVSAVVGPDDLLPTALAKARGDRQQLHPGGDDDQGTAAQEPDGSGLGRGDGAGRAARPDCAPAARPRRGGLGVPGEARGAVQPLDAVRQARSCQSAKVGARCAAGCLRSGARSGRLPWQCVAHGQAVWLCLRCARSRWRRRFCSRSHASGRRFRRKNSLDPKTCASCTCRITSSART